jgi:CheY-like chemotaxis protein
MELSHATEAVRPAGAFLSQARHAPGIAVLLIEGEAELREALFELLEGFGYRVQCAASMAAALKIERRPDVVLCGALLPDGDGASLLGTLRARAGWRDLPAVALGRSSAEAEAEARQYVFDRFLLRPVCLEDVDLALRSVVVP